MSISMLIKNLDKFNRSSQDIERKQKVMKDELNVRQPKSYIAPPFSKRGYTNLNIKRIQLEDLKVLRCSPDLLNNVTIVQCKIRLIMKHILLYHIRVAAILVK